MGCCESCLGKKDDEPNERTPILNHDVTTSVNTGPVIGSCVISEQPHDGSLSSNVDEQSILTGIIKQYNNEAIDITALDTKIDAVEYMNRVQLYNRKVATLTSGSRHKQSPLYSAGSNPSYILSSPPVTIEDVFLITQLSGDIRNAMASVKVKAHKELVLSLAHR